MKPGRMLVVTAAMTVLAVIGALRNLTSIPGRDDSISRAELRFQPLKSGLPVELRPPYSQVGYVSDTDPDSSAGSAARLLAQYTLAPLILVPALPFPPVNIMDPALRPGFRPVPGPAATPAWFIGNFSDPATAAAIANREGLTVARDFGSGVMLLRRKQP